MGIGSQVLARMLARAESRKQAALSHVVVCDLPLVVPNRQPIKISGRRLRINQHGLDAKCVDRFYCPKRGHNSKYKSKQRRAIPLRQFVEYDVS